MTRCRQFRLLATVAPAAIAAMWPTLATAQDTGADTAVLEELIVTGSYIRRSGFDGPQPLQVLDQEALSVQGANNITDIVKNIAVNTGSEFNFDRTNQNFTFGTSQFNIRGLGLGATLTLINGRRTTKSAAVANDGSQFVDVNALPLNMIERIEILKDGASALYGSDAVAGVVNLITRKAFEGFEIEGQYQTTTESSQEDITLSSAFGAGNERSHVSFFFTYLDRSDLRGLDRAFFPRQTDAETNTGQGIPGTFFPAIPNGSGGFVVAPGAPGVAPGGAVPPPSLATGTGPVPDPRCLDRTGLGTLPDGTVLASNELLGPGPGTRAGISPGDDIAFLGANVRGFCSYNFAPFFSLVPDERRALAFAQASHEFSEHVAFFGEFNFADNRSTVDASPSLPNQFAPILVPANNPFIPTVAENGGILNPVFHNADGSPRAVFVQFRVKSGIEGPGNMQVDTQTWRAVSGLKYDIDGNWNGEIAYQYSRNETSFSDNANTVTSLAKQALAGTLPGFEGIFLNPFASSLTTEPNDPNLVDAIIRTSERFTRAEQTTVDGHISGEIAGLDLGAGAVGVAVGLQYRRDTFLLDNDDLLNIGDDFFQPAAPDGAGAQDVVAVFTEVSVPVMSGLELQAALRYEDYGGAIGDTLDPKIALRWQAADWIGLRASYGTSFRAPNVTQTDIDEAGTQRLNDPFAPGPGGLTCSVDANGNITGTIRGSNTAFGKEANPDLKPETSKNFNVGAVVQPLDGFSVSLDFWHYDYNNVIVLEDNQSIVFNDCLDDGIANDPRVTRLNGNIINVSRAFFNAASITTSGLDLQLTYGMDVGALGNVAATANVSWVNEFDIDLGAFGDGTVIDGVGSRNRTNPFRTVPEFRANFPLDWTLGNSNVNATLRYVDGVTDDATGFHVPSHTTVDLQYRYVLEGLLGDGHAMTLTVGAVNLFNNHVPKIPGETFGFDSKLHDPRERLVYVRLKQNF